MIKCNECTHFHDQATRLFCDAGVMDVTIVGGAVCVAEMIQCVRFDGKQPSEGIMIAELPKLDKRSREYKLMMESVAKI